MGYYGYGWAPYVPVQRKIAMARKLAAQEAKKQKREPMPVETKRRLIATSFWGKAWCDNLQAYSDYANRLPRGATYVRNGSVVDLVVNKGSVRAIVAGSEPYKVQIAIKTLEPAKWNKIKRDCSASIDSLVDLLGGRLSSGVMRRLTEKKDGCFPTQTQISMSCSCPDYSTCCKHIAAVMYGIGCRLDAQPELLFLLRGVDHMELVSQAVSSENLDRELSAGIAGEFAGADLGEIFGIELDSAFEDGAPTASPQKTTRRPKAAAKVKASGTKVVAREKASSAPKAASKGKASGVSKAKPKPKAKVTTPVSAKSKATAKPSVTVAQRKTAKSKPISKPMATSAVARRSK